MILEHFFASISSPKLDSASNFCRETKSEQNFVGPNNFLITFSSAQTEEDDFATLLKGKQWQ